jgi:hypothetical protein
MIPTAYNTDNEEPKAENSGSKRSHRDPSDEEGDSKRAALSAEDASVGDSQPEDAEEEARKLEEKRAYNRRNAARARQRVKDQLTDLSEKVENFSHQNDNLKQDNEELREKVNMLTEENQSLKLHMSSNGLAVVGAGTPGGFNMQQGPSAKSDLLSLTSQREADVGQLHKGWNTGTGLSSSGQEQKDSSSLPSQLLLARQQQMQQHQQQLHLQHQQQPPQGSEGALTLQLLLARELERQRGHASGTPQEASSSALTSLTSRMFSGRQADQHPPPSLPFAGAGAPGVQQGGDEADRQRAIIMALLSQNQRN